MDKVVIFISSPVDSTQGGSALRLSDMIVLIKES